MTIQWDPILFINLILCIIIFVLGAASSRKTGERLPLQVGIAFGLFGVSHAATLAGLKGSLTVLLIAVRTLAYLLVIYALIRYLRLSRMSKEATQAWVDYYKGETKPKSEAPSDQRPAGQ